MLRTGSRTLGRGVGSKSHAGTRPMPPRRVCARQLHAGTSGSPCERAYKPEVLRRVQLRVGRGKATPSPAELARRLQMTESGGRWAALRNTMQFAHLLQRDVPGPGPASYLTTGVHDSFELIVRYQARSPTSSFLLCSLFSDALGLPQAVYLAFPPLERMGGGCPPPPCAARSVRDPITECPAAVNKSAALHWAPRPRILGRARRRVGGTLDTMGPRGSNRIGGMYSAPALSRGGGAFVEKNGAGAG